MPNNLRKGRWNPSRVMTAIGRIGYSPAAAILDIVDNSVSSGAKNVTVDLEVKPEERTGVGRRRRYLASITIIDDGCGMTDDGLDEAIALGSTDRGYKTGTLSRFGLGLKSASASLGNCLTITTRVVGANARTAVLDQDVIAEQDDYVYTLGDATDDDLTLLNAVAGQGPGTAIRITKVDQTSMISPGEILAELQHQAGVVYLYAIRDGGLTLTIGGQVVDAFDPLFAQEATQDLDERTWDGTTVAWIHHEQAIQLNEEGSVFGKLTMTQLPHPPSVGQRGPLTQPQAREKYNIGSGNYGFYVYRNGRLISWAASLGMVSQDQDLFSFRGRLEIGSDADAALNIDVTKSRILLSDTAKIQLRPIVDAGTKKSRIAWGTAKSVVDSFVTSSPHEEINEQLNRISAIDEKNDELDDEAAPADEREKIKRRRQEAVGGRVSTPQEQETVKEQNQRVIYVGMLPNNALWERAHDPEVGLIVRVNMSHRLYRDVIQPLVSNGPLIKVLDVLFFGMARAEYDLVYKTELLDTKKAEKLMDEYRERVGNQISEIIRLANSNVLTTG